MQATTDHAARQTAAAESAVFTDLAATCLKHGQALIEGRATPDADLFDLAVLADAAIDPEDSTSRLDDKFQGALRALAGE
jgi:hypothetical protein